MKRLFAAVLATALLALAGCSGDSDASSPSSPASEPAAPAAPDAASPSPSLSAVPVEECVRGRYRLMRFVALGEAGSYGAGQDGDVTVSFDDDSYTLDGAGRDPIKLTLAGQQAGLLLNGTISGDYRLAGDRASFTVGQSSGSATLNVGRLKKSLPMSQLANAVASDGEATVACASNALIVTLPDARLELGRV
jgi:hypothetical protein